MPALFHWNGKNSILAGGPAFDLAGTHEPEKME